MTLLDELNHFRGAFLTKIVIDRKKTITTAPDGAAELYGPAWPAVTFSLNHINHARYRGGQGPHLFQVEFGMVHRLAGFADLMGESMIVGSITFAIPPALSDSTPPIAAMVMGSGKQITFAFGSISIAPRKR